MQALLSLAYPCARVHTLSKLIFLVAVFSTNLQKTVLVTRNFGRSLQYKLDRFSKMLFQTICEWYQRSILLIIKIYRLVAVFSTNKLGRAGSELI